MIRLRVVPAPPSNPVYGTRVYFQQGADPEIDISGLIRTVTWRHAAGETPVYTLEVIGVTKDFVVEAQEMLVNTGGEAFSVRPLHRDATDDANLAEVTSLIATYRRKVTT